jgi:hypothetical protein
MKNEQVHKYLLSIKRIFYFVWTSPSCLNEVVVIVNSKQLSGDSMVKLVVMAKDNSRESHWSLMMLYSYCSISGRSSCVVILTRNHMMLLCVVTSMVMLTARVMVLVVSVAVVIVVLLLCCLPLAVLLVFHSSILKPDLHLSLRQI